MYQSKICNELNTKDVPFEEVLEWITPMIEHIAIQVNGLYGLEYEDVKQELSIQAYAAWEKWEPNRGTKFSTYVFDILVNRKNGLIRIARAKKRNCGVVPASLDAPMETKDTGNGTFCLYDVLADIQQDPEMRIQAGEVLDAVERAIASMQEKGQGVIRALLSGYTQMEISRFTGTTQPLVSYYLKSFRTKVRAEMERSGLM